MTPYLHQYSVVVQKMHNNKDKVMPELHLPAQGAIWNEFGKQNQHQSIKKAQYLMTN